MKNILNLNLSFESVEITELYLNFGYEGIGLFYTVLQKLSCNNKPMKTSIITHQCKIGKKLIKCFDYLINEDLLSIDENGNLYSKYLK